MDKPGRGPAVKKLTLEEGEGDGEADKGILSTDEVWGGIKGGPRAKMLGEVIFVNQRGPLQGGGTYMKTVGQASEGLEVEEEYLRQRERPA